MVRDIPIRGSMIRLGQLLKLAGLIDTGAEVKALLSTEQVWVNGEKEERRGRQLWVQVTSLRSGSAELRLIGDVPFPGESGWAQLRWLGMLGGGDLLGVGGGGCVLLSSDAFDLGDGLRGHGHAAPAAA